MNVICLLGRLTADPELRHTASQIPVTSFTVAVDRAFQPKGSEQRQADFIPVVAWRNTAEFVCRYFHKGQRIAVNGSLQSRQYTDKEGNKRTAYEVVADNVYFAESKNASGPSTGAGMNPRFRSTMRLLPPSPTLERGILRRSSGTTSCPSDLRIVIIEKRRP